MSRRAPTTSARAPATSPEKALPATMVYAIVPNTMAASTRERMLRSTALLMRERGARATSIDEVLRHSGAPRGSVYHHFPGGREQLLAEAVDYAGDVVAEAIARWAPEELLAGFDRFVAAYRKTLLATDFRAGCPVVAVAVEAREDEDAAAPVRAAAAFARWDAALVDRFAAAGIAPGRACELATLVLAAVEGALVLARSRRSTEPLDTIHAQLRRTIADELSPTTGSDA
jgi:AcrR family transcriptional regulator